MSNLHRDRRRLRLRCPPPCTRARARWPASVAGCAAPARCRHVPWLPNCSHRHNSCCEFSQSAIILLHISSSDHTSSFYRILHRTGTSARFVDFLMDRLQWTFLTENFFDLHSFFDTFSLNFCTWYCVGAHWCCSKKVSIWSAKYAVVVSIKWTWEFYCKSCRLVQWVKQQIVKWRRGAIQVVPDQILYCSSIYDRYLYIRISSRPK
jgi:hypothetical protein